MPTPAKDRTRPQVSRIFPETGSALKKEFNGCLWNGDYQQILWLGVGGFVVVNHVDREIVLVDPWPTVCSPWVGKIPFVKDRPLRNSSGRAKGRISELAGFLRRSRKSGYVLSSILLSHMHFDHTDDVPLLLELLAAPAGPYRSRRNLDFQLEGPAVPVSRLPVVCADLDTLLYLKAVHFDLHWLSAFSVNEPKKIKERYFEGQGELLEMIEAAKPKSNPVWDKVKKRYSVTANAWAWHEITWDLRSMFHDDVFNDHALRGPLASRRRKPGTPADSFSVPGSVFEIQPYVWDHMKTPVFNKPKKDSLDDQQSGRYQRITAFLMKRKGAKGAKRTFFVGSAGEMGKDFTRPKPPADMAPIETDVLVQAIQANDMPWVPDPLLGKMMKASRRFTLARIAVRDYLVFAHFEEFVRQVAGKKKFRQGFEAAAGDAVAGYRKLIADGSCLQENADLVSGERIFVLDRWGFERRFTGSASGLKNLA